VIRGSFWVWESAEALTPVAELESSGEVVRLVPQATGSTAGDDPVDPPPADCACFRGNGSCTKKKCDMNDGCGTGHCMYDGAQQAGG